MPERIENGRTAYQTYRLTEKRSKKKKKDESNPNFLSDDNLDTGRSSITSEYSTTSYSSTCTQTSDARTNTIDSNLRVIRRPVTQPRSLRIVNEQPRGRTLYRVPVRQEDGRTKYVLKRDLGTATLQSRGNERIIVRRRANSLDGNGRVLIRKRSESRGQIVRERPSSYHSRGERVVERRVLRPINNNTQVIPVRRQIVRKVERPVQIDDAVERKIIRKVENPEIITRRVVSKPVQADVPSTKVVRRIITRQPPEVSRSYVIPEEEESVRSQVIRRPRPSSYDGRLVYTRPVERRPRPSSYHNGMEREYIAIKRESDDEQISNVSKDNFIQEKKVIKEHQVKEKAENQRTVKQNKDKWVDEYDVGDTETRDVGVQMTTHYKVPDPPKTKTRNVGIQTKFKPEEKIIIKEVKVKEKPKPKPEPPPLPPPVIPEPEPEPAPKPRYIFVKKPKMKSQYVRVGGGWMKIDHYRNHHIPLQIFEHERRAKDAKKYLSIKYRYTKDRKKTPIAWSKYRSTIAKDS